MKTQIEKALHLIRPSLQAEEGDVELVDVENGIVRIHFTGSCAGSLMSQITLQQSIEEFLKEEIPAVVRVESV